MIVDEDYQRQNLVDEWDRTFFSFFEKYTDKAKSLIPTIWEDKIGREMIVEIFKFASLADKSGEVPMLNTQQAQIFMLVSMGEVIYKMSHPESKLKKRDMFEHFFMEYLCDDEDTFKYGFQRCLTDIRVDEKGVWFTPEDLIEVLYDLRSQFTHEGIGYEFHFSDGEYDTLCHIVFHGKRMSLNMRMSYEEIKAAFVRMAVRCVEDYLDSK